MSMSSEPDAQLVARCRAGEAAAWNELFDAHYAPTARFVFQLSSDFSREDAEEICQESFLSVIKNIHSFSGGSRLQTWIFRIAANKSRDYRERLRAVKRGGGEKPVSLQAPVPGSPQQQLDLPGNSPAPDVEAMKADDATKLISSLDQLDPPCREVIQLRYFGDLSYEELAAELNVNPKTVSSRLSKCLDKLTEIAADVFSWKKESPFSV